MSSHYNPTTISSNYIRLSSCNYCNFTKIKKMKNSLKAVVLLVAIIFFSCNEKKGVKNINKPKIERNKPKELAYTFQNATEWLKKEGKNAKAKDLVLAINRVDETNLKKLDSIVVPKDITGDIEYYMPFPVEIEKLNEVKKIILFSYATQAFAAYEYGSLVHVGPTSMGREKDKTPTGLFFTNWKAQETTSTFNDEWELKWNFNIENKLGVGFHEYVLPGYPASHSCLRLLEKDAKKLYEFADQWVLSDPNTVKLKGTPVIVFGSYNFGADKPWIALKDNPKALAISEKELNSIIEPHLREVLQEQAKRENR